MYKHTIKELKETLASQKNKLQEIYDKIISKKEVDNEMLEYIKEFKREKLTNMSKEAELLEDKISEHLNKIAGV